MVAARRRGGPPIIVILFVSGAFACLLQSSLLYFVFNVSQLGEGGINSAARTHSNPRNTNNEPGFDPIIPPKQGDVYHKGSLPAALQLWQEYQEQHSHYSLVRYPDNRQFQVVYYSCPHAAGNILHDFFHQVLVAVALNRTMLWKYNDKKTCERVNQGYSPILCLTDNAEPDCNRILQRAPWLPSYDAWVENLELEKLPPQRHPRFRPFPAQTNNATFNTLLWLNERVITMTPRVYQTPERFLLIQNPFLKSPLSASRIARLYSESTDYLYGMLFRGIFSFPTEILPSDYDERQRQRQSSDSGTDETTFALHSRHRSPKDDGSNVEEYIHCLDSVFKESRALQDRKQRQQPQSHSKCKVFLMADRNTTLHELDHVIRTKQCTPVVATHKSSAGHFKEHGPFAGAGFFQDLALASQARNGLIGHCDRSSTQLLRELIHYDRTMEALATGTYPELPELPTCCLT